MDNLECLTAINADIALIKQLNDTNDIDSRVRCAERLAANSYYLSRLVSDAYEGMEAIEAEYDNAVAFDEDTFTGPATRARAYAKNKNSKLNTELSKAKATFKRLLGLLQQCTVVIEQTRQTNAHLRDERKYSF